MDLIMLIAATVAAAVKLADIGIAGWVLVSTGRQIHGVAWTPIFAFTSALHEKARRGSQVVATAIDVCFRAPVVSIAIAVVLYDAVHGPVRSRMIDGRCVLRQADGLPEWLVLAAALSGILITASTVVFLLATELLAIPGGSRVAGNVYFRARGGSKLAADPTVGADQPATDWRRSLTGNISPILVIPAMAAAFICGFGALYHCIVAINPAALSLSQCRFNAIDSIYFSTTTSSTAGYGDITARSPGAEAAVTSQLLIAITLFALYFTLLVGRLRGST
jgi:hypothetical protein